MLMPKIYIQSQFLNLISEAYGTFHDGTLPAEFRTTTPSYKDNSSLGRSRVCPCLL